MVEQPGHELHGLVDAAEKGLVTGAEVVQARLTVWGRDEAILRTLAFAGKADLAFEAVARERVAFVVAELSLLIGSKELNEMRRLDVAEEVLRLDEVVAAIDVTVVLEHNRAPTGLREDADARGEMHPGQRVPRRSFG